jgi:hypothetical protein
MRGNGWARKQVRHETSVWIQATTTRGIRGRRGCCAGGASLLDPRETD